MKLVKDGIVMDSQNENVIAAFLAAGFVEEKPEEVKPKASPKRKPKE